MKKERDFPLYLTKFLTEYLPGQKNVSINTIASYRDTFRLFLTFCQKSESIKPEKLIMSAITKDLVLRFLEWIETERGCSIITRNQRLSSLHSFFRYVQKEFPEELYEINRILSIPNKKHPKTMVPFLTGEEMKILLEQPDAFTVSGFRDRVLLSVLYDTAARVQELIDIKVKDIRLSVPAVITLHGKGNKTRQVPIMGKTTELLKNYLEVKRYNTGLSKTENYVFVNQKHQQLSRWGVSYIINKYASTAKENPAFSVDFPITPHVFRHSKSVHLLQAGVNLIYIRDFLGHVDCSTTEIYARADTEMKRKAIEKAYEDLTPEPLPKWEEDGDLMKWLNSLCE